MQYTDLHTHYMNAFNVCMLHKFISLTEYENMHPFEFDLYTMLLNEHNKTEMDKMKSEQSLERELAKKGY